MSDRSPRGRRMPETREQFEEMADLCEQALLRKDTEIALLKARVNRLQQWKDKHNRQVTI